MKNDNPIDRFNLGIWNSSRLGQYLYREKVLWHLLLYQGLDSFLSNGTLCLLKNKTKCELSTRLQYFIFISVWKLSSYLILMPIGVPTPLSSVSVNLSIPGNVKHARACTAALPFSSPSILLKTKPTSKTKQNHYQQQKTKQMWKLINCFLISYCPSVHSQLTHVNTTFSSVSDYC